MNDLSEPNAGLLRLAEATQHRIEKIVFEGATYWVKRPETLKPRMRLQKGSPDAAFARERLALQKLGDLGAPVPRLMIDQPRLIVTEDCGPNLLRLRRNRDNPELTQMFFAGGLALAKLHRFGHTHGRPALKDMCWQGGAITIIDFERSHPSLDHARGRARDVVLLFINVLHAMGGPCAELDAMRAGYLSGDTDGTWNHALRWSRNLTWMSLATAPLRLLPLPIHEVRTMPVARDYFRAQKAQRNIG